MFLFSKKLCFLKSTKRINERVNEIIRIAFLTNKKVIYTFVRLKGLFLID